MSNGNKIYLFNYGVLFLPIAFMIINIISATTAITKKIPKPIPALKMAAMASHELNIVEIISNRNTLTIFEFFMDEMF